MHVLKVGDWLLQLDDSSAPRELVIEVSTRCNLACTHCFRWSSSDLKEYDMSLEDYRRIIDNAVSSGVRRVVLTGWGEPTANPNITDMLKYAKNRNLEVALNTNGVELDRFVDNILEVGVDELYVSVDAVDIELYEKIRRLGDLNKVSAAIAELTRLKAVRGLKKPVVKSIFTVNKLNLGQILKLPEFSSAIGVQEVYLSLYVHTPTGIPGVDCINDEACLRELKVLIDTLARGLVNSPVKLWTPGIGSYTFRECPFAASKALYVRVDGKVAPCLFLSRNWTVIIEGTRRHIREYIVGDALREGLADVWKRIAKMYFKLYFNYMPSCLDCNLRNWCSYTLSTEADCWGNSPNCSFCPYHYRLTYCPL